MQVNIELCRHVNLSFSPKKAGQQFNMWKRVALFGIPLGFALGHILHASDLTFFQRRRLSGVAKIFVADQSVISDTMSVSLSFLYISAIFHRNGLKFGMMTLYGIDRA